MIERANARKKGELQLGAMQIHILMRAVAAVKLNKFGKQDNKAACCGACSLARQEREKSSRATWSLQQALVCLSSEAGPLRQELKHDRGAPGRPRDRDFYKAAKSALIMKHKRRRRRVPNIARRQRAAPVGSHDEYGCRPLGQERPPTTMK